jgi:low affinity Fe/Cu permease
MTTPTRRAFSGMAHTVVRWCAGPLPFIGAFLCLAGWLIAGPAYHFSNAWQQVASTATSVVTFLMVFLIQHAQSHNAAAIQAKLDELIRTSAAQNQYIAIEELPEAQLAELRGEVRESAAPR